METRRPARLSPLPGGVRPVPAEVALGAEALLLASPSSSTALLAERASTTSSVPPSPGGSTPASPSGGAATAETGKSAAKSVHGYFVDSIRHTDGWDHEEDDSEEDKLNLSGTFTCSRGPGGILSLSVLSDVPTRGSFEETLSSPSAIKGSKLKWVRGDNIGRGSLGTVFQAMDQETGQVFAVKEVFIDPDDESDRRFKADLENEINICKDLSHPRIVSFIGHDYMDSCLYIYLEYMPGGSLAQVLGQFGAFDESLIAVYTREVLEGLEYLHTRQPPVVHRDIKGANILVGLDCRVKLSDFGCSKRQMETMSHTMRGSIPWMAPEVIRSTGYGRTADIWSFGCVVIEMATASNPWGQFDNPMAAMVKIGMSDALPPVPDFLSSTCREFISLCLQRDASKRPPATSLLQHDFVRDVVVAD